MPEPVTYGSVTCHVLHQHPRNIETDPHTQWFQLQRFELHLYTPRSKWFKKYIAKPCARILLTVSLPR